VHIAIVTNLDNGKGLERDYRLLRSLLEQWGHDVVGVHFQRHGEVRAAKGWADLAILLEVCEPCLLDVATRRWLVPNPEWWSPDRTALLGEFEQVLCKTKDALQRFAPLAPRAEYFGFTSEDRHQPGVVRARRFLHVAGGSVAKGTNAILEAWARFRLPYSLTVVSSLKFASKAPNVEFLGRVDTHRLSQLQNVCQFHLCPSEYEGWGHTIHEGLSVGAAVLTSDAPPMNEFAGVAYHIPPARSEQRGLASTALVAAPEVRDAVERAVAYTDAELRRIAATALDGFLDLRERFIGRLWQLLGNPRRSVQASAAHAEPVSRKSVIAAPTSGPRVAVVFPTHASGAPLLRRSVFALRAQTAPPESFEVVVACDGGDAMGTIRAAVEPASHPFHVTLVEASRSQGPIPHRNHARNAGWQASRAPLCCMMDADFLLEPCFIEHLLAEHDAAIRRGMPAVFTPVMAKIGFNPDAWLTHSTVWAASGSSADFAGMLASTPIEGGVHSGYEQRYRPGPPSSERLGDLLEGMPILWRGLIKALGGFDEWFVGWGAEKEVFVDLVKGVQRSGSIDVRLLTSARALHQPHQIDPESFRPEVRNRQTERERRRKEISQGARWWRERLGSARAAIEDAIDTTDPQGAGWNQYPEHSANAVESRSAQIEFIVARTVPHIRGLLGGVIVVGKGKERLAERICETCGLATRSIEPGRLLELPRSYACGVVITDLAANGSPGECERILGEARRVVKAAGPVIVLD
jgi:hypothetical protein